MDAISARSGVAAERQGHFPEDFAGVLVKDSEGFVGGRAYKEEPTRRH